MKRITVKCPLFIYNFLIHPKTLNTTFLNPVTLFKIDKEYLIFKITTSLFNNKKVIRIIDKELIQSDPQKLQLFDSIVNNLVYSREANEMYLKMLCKTLE